MKPIMMAYFNGIACDTVAIALVAYGTDCFTLDATLTTQAVQVGGFYEGTFNVIVDYY